MREIDRWVGLALALLATAVLWSASAFPNVPGQKLGAGTLPTMVGAGLLLCGVLLALRGWRSRDGDAPSASSASSSAPSEPPGPGAEHYGSAAVILAVVLVYIVLADQLGFLLLAPPALAAIFRAFHVGWRPTVAWAIGGTLVVHLAFYKLLRVPLPWGVLRPFY